MQAFLDFIVALSITMALVPLLIRVAPMLSAIDVPGERKVHVAAIPRVGGFAMVAGVVVSMFLWVDEGDLYLSILSAIIVLSIFGFFDDTRDLDYRLKFLGQIIAACLVIFFGDVRLDVMPFFGYDPVSPILSISVTLIFIVGVTNAINLSDGLDGLAGGISLISLGAIGVMAYMSGAGHMLNLAVAVMGCVFGFLRYNTYPARIFMGDTGSQFLGFILAVLSIILTQQVNQAMSPVVPLLLLGVPIIDTLWVMGQRIKSGKSPFVADKNHIHHRLINLGMAHYEAVTFVYMAQFAFVVSAYLLRYESDATVFVAYIALVVAVIAYIKLGKREGVVVGLSGKRNRLTGFVSYVDDNNIIKELPFKILMFAIPVYLAVKVFSSSKFSPDIVIASIFLVILYIVRLGVPMAGKLLPLRILVFTTIAFALYSAQNSGAGFMQYYFPVKVMLVVGSLIVLFAAIRYSKHDSFRTTPTDFIVVLMVILATVLTQNGVLAARYAALIVELVVLFYAAELVLRKMETKWNPFTVGMLANAALIALTAGISVNS